VVSIYLNIKQIKIIRTTLRTTSNPFQHRVCQTVKTLKLSQASDVMS